LKRAPGAYRYRGQAPSTRVLLQRRLNVTLQDTNRGQSCYGHPRLYFRNSEHGESANRELGAGELHGVIEQGHEAEIHVQLLMAVKQGEAGIIGNEVDFGFLVSAYHNHIFHHS
jgi:hypothetical protein